MAETNADFPAKLQFLFEPWRYKVPYGGRGSGKSWGIARALLIDGARKPQRIVCARETMQSIKDSVHELLAQQIDILGLGGFYQVQQAAILGSNDTRFSFHGLRDQSVHNIKSLEGADKCWVSEAHKVSKRSWDILAPTIRKDGSEIYVDFNPEFESDETYRRFVVKPPPEYVDGKPYCKVVKINWQDNPWFTGVLRREMELLRETRPDDYLHIYEGMCKTVTEGAIYKQELIAAEKADPPRITTVPYDATHPVHTFWDTGWSDSTCIWFAQAIGFEFRLIDYMDGCQQSLQFYLKALQGKPYVYGTHYLPHDAQAHSIGSDRTVEEQMRAAGFEVEIVPKLSIADGIAAARAIFGRCYFDRERTADGIQGLRHYRYEADEKLGTFKRDPLHDWASHPADAFRYFAVAITEPKRQMEQARKQLYVYPGQQAQSWMS